MHKYVVTHLVKQVELILPYQAERTYMETQLEMLIGMMVLHQIIQLGLISTLQVQPLIGSH